MTVIKQYIDGDWETILVGATGPQGPPGPPWTSTQGVVDVRTLGVTPDSTRSGVGGTNWTPTLQPVVDALPAGSGLYFPSGPWTTAYKMSDLSIKKSFTILGDNPLSTFFVPDSSIVSTRGIFNFDYDAADPSQRYSHLQKPRVENIGIGGLDRTVPMRGIVLDRCDRGYFANIAIEDVNGAGLRLLTSCRENTFTGIIIRMCGNAADAALDCADTGSSDGHNNNRFVSGEAVYSQGVAIRVRNIGGTPSGVRGHWFRDFMVHGGDGGYVGPPLEWIKYPLLDIGASQNTYFSGRLYNPGRSQPIARVWGASSLYVVAASLGLSSASDGWTIAGVPIVSNVFTPTGGQAANLGTGAIVRVNGGGLTGTVDRWVIRLSTSTFSIATSYANALAGTAETLTDGTATISASNYAIDLGPESTFNHGHMSLCNGMTTAAGFRAAIGNRTTNAAAASVAQCDGLVLTI